MNKIFLILMLGILLISLTSATDEQAFFSCGGDEQTTFVCSFGDIQTNNPFVFKREVGGQEVLEVVPSEAKKPVNIFEFPYYVYFIIIPLIIVILMVLLVSKKKNK